MALLLPAVQVARETSRRMLCGSNQRQLAQATVDYEGLKQNLPASRYISTASITGGNPNIYTWVNALLPVMDNNGARYIDQQESVGINFNFDPTVSLNLPLLKCSSDDFADSGGGADGLSYACNSGRMNYEPENNLPGGKPLDYAANGLFADRVKNLNTTTIFNASLADVSNADGTGNTIMFAENVNLKTWRTDITSVPATDRHEFYFGVIWLDPTVGSFSNFPGLNKQLPSNTFYPLDAYHARPGSFHPSGFMVAMADGSTRFLSDEIRYDVFCRLMTSNGRKTEDPDCVTPVLNVNSVRSPYPAWQFNPLQADDY